MQEEQQRYISINDLLRLIRVSRATYYRWARLPGFPKPFKAVREGMVRLPLAEVLEWIEKQRTDVR